MIDIEKKLYDVKDSIKMPGMGDRLERIVNDTKASAGVGGMRQLSEEELDMVAGGRTYLSGGFEGKDATAQKKAGLNPKPKGGMIC